MSDKYMKNLTFENIAKACEGRYMYAMGGVGNGEMFRQPYTQILSMATNGLQEGEMLDWGGLFGKGPVMNVNKFSPSKFIARGGQIPAPLHSLKN